jgi:hypothetical protein
MIEDRFFLHDELLALISKLSMLLIRLVFGRLKRFSFEPESVDYLLVKFSLFDEADSRRSLFYLL